MAPLFIVIAVAVAYPKIKDYKIEWRQMILKYFNCKCNVIFNVDINSDTLQRLSKFNVTTITTETKWEGNRPAKCRGEEELKEMVHLVRIRAKMARCKTMTNIIWNIVMPVTWRMDGWMDDYLNG